MKLTLETDAGQTIVWQDVTDLFVAMRQNTLMAVDGVLVPTQHTLSRSWGASPRELAKEVAQASIELQYFLREQRNGGTS